MEALLSGGKGVITVTGNIAPKYMHLMCKAAIDGNRKLAEKYPESYDNYIPEELVYTGTKKLTEKLTEMNIDAGKLVL